jgi:hypothetical protein
MMYRGNISLQEVVEQKHPKYHFYGHLHICNHNILKHFVFLY